jgi:hypothetical protein
VNYNRADHHASVWRPGVFAESFKRSMPASCWSHDLTRPIGRAIDADDRRDGLDLRVKLADPEAVPDAKMARSLLADGIIHEFSFTFERHGTLSVPANQRSAYGALPAREIITSADFIEVSPVVAASGVGTQLLAVRSKSRGAMVGRDLDDELSQLFARTELRCALARANERAAMERRDRAFSAVISAERHASDAGSIDQIRRMSRRLEAAGLI